MKPGLSGVLLPLLLAATANTSVPAQQVPAEQPTVKSARAAMLQATEFFAEHISQSGGYLWQYSSDLQQGEGEVPASRTTVWVQPPGTPSVGEAFLYAWQLTDEPALKQAAVAAGQALIRGQLQSGGWDYRIEFAEEDRRRYAYRSDGAPQPGNNVRNTTTLDDNTTQAALRFLMHLDQELRFQDAAVHDAAQYAIRQLLAAQYPNGAWPQRFSEPAPTSQHPPKQASFPEDWSRTWPREDYRNYYTFNDNAIGDMVDTMLEAAAIYDDPRCLQAAISAGDFILRAQLPEPQPAWAQQYNLQMQPAWARKFEPPAVTGGESQSVMKTLLTLYQHTGERRFLEPIPKALKYLKASARQDGRLARFYEIGTNRPLYFTRDYQLTYSDADMPTHYGFITSNGLNGIERRYQQLLQRDPQQLKLQPYRRPDPPPANSKLADQAAQAITALDRRGAWIESGDLDATPESSEMVISSRTFIRNLQTLAEFVAASGATR